MYFPRYIPMEQYKRELFVSRISAGYLRYKHKNEVLKIYSPSLDDMYEAQEIYDESYDKAIKMGILELSDMVDMMKHKKLWCDEDDNQLENVLPAHIERFKTMIYQQFSNEKERETIRKYLNCAQDAISDLYSKKHMYDYITAHGIATFSRWQFLVEVSTRSNNVQVDWETSQCTLFSVMQYINKNIISETIIRDLARSEPWRTIWLSGKKGGCPIFSLPASALSDEQRKIISWSALYDNVGERSDAPPDCIIKDDDAFDGWMIVKSEEATKEKEVQDTKRKINKAASDAPEVFFVASDDDPNALFSKSEIGKIYGLNDASNRNIINQRLNMIKDRGEVKESEFPDVQRELNIARNQAAIKAMRR